MLNWTIRLTRLGYNHRFGSAKIEKPTFDWTDFPNAARNSQRSMLHSMLTSLLLLLHHFLDSRPLHQSLHPLFIQRTFLLHLLQLLLRTAKQKPSHSCPRHESEVGVGALVASEVGFPTGFEGSVDDAVDAKDLVLVPGDGAGEFFMVEVTEPVTASRWSIISFIRSFSRSVGRSGKVNGDCWEEAGKEREKSIPCRLPEISPLPRRLEEQPLLRVIFLGSIFIAQLALLVVRIDQILEDGTTFPELHPCIWILDCGNTRF